MREPTTCSIDKSDGPALARGWCSKHYQRWLAHGDPNVTMCRARGDLLDELRAASSATAEDCIILSAWRPGIRHVLFRGHTTTASRAVWILAYGDPGPLFVLHTCNGGSGAHGCINIGHLYLGDNAQNMHDMVEAGRAAQHAGVTNGRAKLTEDDVREIRRRYVRGRGPYDPGTGAALRREFGIGPSAFSAIVRGKHWTDVR